MFARVSEAKDRYGRWRTSQMHIVLEPFNSKIVFPFVGLQLQASRLPYATPLTKLQSRLELSKDGRIRVYRDDKLASLFLRGYMIHELPSKPLPKLHVMDQFEVIGVCRKEGGREVEGERLVISCSFWRGTP